MKFFNLWDTTEIKVQDPGIKPYLNIKPVLVPKTGGKNRKHKFHKSRTTIVERLINKLMVAGHKGKKHKISSYHQTGKGSKAYKIVLKTFKIIEQKTNQNPLKIFIQAIENATPREEITTIEYGGARYPQAVDVSPLRRVNLAIKHIIHGAGDKAFNKKKTIAQTLAEEIILAADESGDSFALRKKKESEAQADSAR